MKKIILSSLVILGVIGAVAVSTRAYFFDTETSNGNTFTSGNLNLTLDSNDGINTVKWTLSNLVPGNQPKGHFVLANTGSINGFVDLENIQITSHENTLIEPEIDAGDTSSDEGELEDVLGMTLFWDKGCDGWFSAGDEYIFNGKAADIAASYDKNIPVAAGASVCVEGIFNWWSTAEDNKAMTDSFDLDMAFELGQTTAQ
jgi:predicted ribosomally synthesized peptide with SipW-like signal peptide